MGLYFDGKKIVDTSTNSILAQRSLNAQWVDPFGGQFSRQDLEDFDRALLEHVEAELRSKSWKREEILDFLQWNDSNGVYTDKASREEGVEKLTKEEAIDLALDVVRDAYETPGEIRRLSRRP